MLTTLIVGAESNDDDINFDFFLLLSIKLVVSTLNVGDNYIDIYSSAYLNFYLPSWAWPGTSRPLNY
jgi:hypothetical protein